MSLNLMSQIWRTYSKPDKLVHAFHQRDLGDIDVPSLGYLDMSDLVRCWLSCVAQDDDILNYALWLSSLFSFCRRKRAQEMMKYAAAAAAISPEIQGHA